MSKSTDSIDDKELRRKLKKLTAPYFFKGKPPKERGGKLIFPDPVRQAIYDTLCRGDARDVRARRAGACATRMTRRCGSSRSAFPDYEPFRFIPSVRLTRTLFENLHWDNHSIDDDFHQARIFANLDSRPRIWSISHRFTDWVRDHYDEHDLGRFAGKDPNLMLDLHRRLRARRNA